MAEQELDAVMEQIKRSRAIRSHILGMIDVCPLCEEAKG
jgi:hypothetical protein